MSLNIIFMGTPEFCVPALRALIESEYNVSLVVTRSDKPKGRGKKLTPPPVKKFSQEQGIEVFQPDDLNDEFVHNKLKSLAPDLIITMAYGKKIPLGILEVPRFGCINVHASLLPKYRGSAPIYWAVINGESETGLTIISMDAGMDTGSILAYNSIPIYFDDTAGDVHDRLSDLAPSFLLETIPDIVKGNIIPVKQDESYATKAPKITREHQKIHWSKEDALGVYNKIRGLNPWPGAYTLWENKRLKLWESNIYDRDNFLAGKGPGEVVDKVESGPIVQCKKGLLCLSRLQLEGKKILQGKDFLKGYNITVGELFKGGE